MVEVMKTMATSFKRSHVLLHSVPPTLQQATADPYLLWRLLDSPGQVWVSLLWGHCSFLLGPDVYKVLLVPSKSLFSQSCVSSGGSVVRLMAISSKRAYTIPRSTAPRTPAPVAVHCWPIPPQDGFSLEITIIKYFHTYLESIKIRAFPGDPLVKNLPCKAGDRVSIPGQETKIPHAVEQQSLHATTTESMCRNKRSHNLDPMQLNKWTNLKRNH